MLFTFTGLDEQEARVLESIGDLRRKLSVRLHEPERWFGPLRRVLEAEAVRASTAIEGFNVDLNDAAAIRERVEPLAATRGDQMALEGYWDAMTYVLQQAKNENFKYDATLIQSLHFMMTKFELSTRPGLWRDGAIYVRDARSGRVLYEGPEAEGVPGLMEELVSELNERTSGSALIDGALAHLNLAMIHPFRDGNGRMARCLQSLVLARDGVLAPVFMSIEEYLGRHTPEYYEALALVGTDSWNPTSNTRTWIRFILKAHYNQANGVLRRISESQRVWSELESLADEFKLPGRMILAMYDATMGFSVRRSTYQAASGNEINDQTATRDFQRLCRDGLLVPRGEKRGRVYVAGPPLQRVRSKTIYLERELENVDPFADLDDGGA